MIQAEPITAKELFESMVEVPVDNTCRTCMFWKEEDDGWGKCTDANCWLRIAKHRGNLFANDFGCRFHQPKEAQNG